MVVFALVRQVSRTKSRGWWTCGSKIGLADMLIPDVFVTRLRQATRTTRKKRRTKNEGGKEMAIHTENA